MLAFSLSATSSPIHKYLNESTIGGKSMRRILSSAKIRTRTTLFVLRYFVKQNKHERKVDIPSFLVLSRFKTDEECDPSTDLLVAPVVISQDSQEGLILNRSEDEVYLEDKEG
jgi:hypothetical protein